MKQTAVNWLIDEAMKLVVQYMQGTLNEDTLDEVIYELGTKAKAMEKKNLKDSFVAGAGMGEMFNNENRCYVSDAEKYLKETFKSE